MEPDAARSVPNLDLLTALCFYGLGLEERTRDCLRRELANHENSLARRFHEDAFKSAAKVDVQQWYAEHAESLTLQKTEMLRVGPPVTRSTPSGSAESDHYHRPAAMPSGFCLNVWTVLWDRR